MPRTLTYLLLIITTNVAFAQFAPSAGIPGSTAIYKDSSAFIDWASGCTLQRGLKNIITADSGYASVGNENSAIGKAGEANFVSLGDGGTAVLTFTSPIYNGPGNDFAVFENSFDGLFLELAHVEVSSDGINFYRFNSTSNTDTNTQVNTFGLLDATKLNNLAGKYKANYGTPFDLEELSGIIGLDIQNITHIKIIDVVGTINPLYASRDGSGKIINDPWPTAFNSGGFDLDAVGIIHSTGNSLKKLSRANINIYPTLLKSGENITVENLNHYSCTLTDILGKMYSCESAQNNIQLPKLLPAGIYQLNLISEKDLFTFKIIIQN
jgi:hypothetical protein